MKGMHSLQALGRSLMLPVSCLPISGLLMGLGYALAPAAMDAGGATEGIAYTVGWFLIQAGGALINNLPLLFAVGVAVGLATDQNGASGLSGLVSYFVITTLLAPDTVAVLAPSLAAPEVNALAFAKIANPFTGMLAGVLGAWCYNRFYRKKLPAVLAFFSGRRLAVIVTGAVSIVVAAVLLFVWPLLFSGLVALGNAIKNLGTVGVGLYAFFNRLLIPTGLHHALNNVFWFDTVGLGDLTAYWSGLVEGGALADGTAVDWSVGSYMAGFFPSMMFGVPGAALAIVQTADKRRKKQTLGIMGASAACAFLCGVTEPFEFAFMFAAFPLYVVYALLYGIVAAITVAVGFRAGFSFSAGATDLLFSSALPAAANTWLIIPLGIGTFLLFYAVFYAAIRFWKLRTPGREAEDAAAPSVQGDTDDTRMAAAFLEAVGGKDNVASSGHCVTRLRLELVDPSIVDEAAIKAAGAAGVIRPSKTALQIVVGTHVQFVAEEFERLMRE